MTLRLAEPRLHGRAIPQGNSCASPSAREWLLRFSPCPPGPPDCLEAFALEPQVSAKVLLVQIAGANSKSVRSVRIHLGSQTKFQVDSVPDGRAGLIPAGVLIEAMAKQFGHEGMTIDLGSLELEAESIGVSVLIAAVDAEAAEKTRVAITASSRS